VLVYLSIALPIILWAAFRSFMKPGPYEMDFSHIHGTFGLIMPWYMKTFSFIAVSGLIGATISWYLRIGKVAVIFLISAILATLFNALIVIFYERYMHIRYPRMNPPVNGVSNYTLTKYSIILSLGISALADFILALVYAAWSLA
jgi:hypothetical protein